MFCILLLKHRYTNEYCLQAPVQGMKRRADMTFCFNLITCFSGWLSRRHMRRQSDSISMNRIIVHIWMDGNIRKTDICITIHKLLNTHKHATIIACTHPIIHTLYSLTFLFTYSHTHSFNHSLFHSLTHSFQSQGVLCCNQTTSESKENSYCK